MTDDDNEGRNFAEEACAESGSGRDKCLATCPILLNMKL
jgi:hypothetical protein